MNHPNSYRKALEHCLLVIEDAINLYAPEFCDPDRVEQARTRVRAVGTLAYYADAIQEARRVLTDDLPTATNCVSEKP